MGNTSGVISLYRIDRVSKETGISQHILQELITKGWLIPEIILHDKGVQLFTREQVASLREVRSSGKLY